MGNIASRRNQGVEEVDLVEYNAYKYPPKSGNSYFANYFYMGGEQFDTIHPEMYLFGENQDLNFLGNRPIPFPYPLTQSNEPSRTLKSLINIRKDSLRFVRVQDNEYDPKNSSKKSSNKDDCHYNIEFTFDSDVNCTITIYYFASEKFTNGYLTYSSREPTMTSPTFHYKRGANQIFSQTSHVIDPSKYSEDDWLHHTDRDIIPVVVHCVVDDQNHATHSHATFGQVEINSDSSYSLKPLKQKQAVDGLCYLIQEIYGIENKNNERSKDHDDEFEDNSSECVICMCEMRDTLILPCRHLCLCSCCANNLRYQANNCPICRAPFRALLQIRALRKKGPYPVQNEEDIPATHDGIPQGYESVSLMEALNGPLHQLPTQQLPHLAAGDLPRTGLLNSPSSSPELRKPCKIPGQLVKPHQSISDMSLSDTAVTGSADDGGGDDAPKMGHPCALLPGRLGSTSPSDTMSSSDRTDLKCSEMSESDDNPDCLSAVPSVEVINEMNASRKIRTVPRLPDLPGSPYHRRPELNSENDTSDVSLDLSPAAQDMSFPSEPTVDEEETTSSSRHSPTPDRELEEGEARSGQEPVHNDGSSGSSYGSTSSSKMLLEGPPVLDDAGEGNESETSS